jgi:hypothetical protein
VPAERFVAHAVSVVRVSADRVEVAPVDA